jgi:hypothetical protein
MGPFNEAHVNGTDIAKTVALEPRTDPGRPSERPLAGSKVRSASLKSSTLSSGAQACREPRLDFSLSLTRTGGGTAGGKMIQPAAAELRRRPNCRRHEAGEFQLAVSTPRPLIAKEIHASTVRMSTSRKTSSFAFLIVRSAQKSIIAFVRPKRFSNLLRRRALTMSRESRAKLPATRRSVPDLRKNGCRWGIVRLQGRQRERGSMLCFRDSNLIPTSAIAKQAGNLRDAQRAQSESLGAARL